MKPNEGSRAEAAVFSPARNRTAPEEESLPRNKDNRKMKIMIFPVKFDKFTGFSINS